ncbi:MAG: ASKHA domain-containing protein, partial [Actinomycetota bacterium]|nr:ASKHA domain-containing protein [Actinomycetota bacterium]
KMNTRGPLADRFTEIDGVVAIDLADSGGSHVVLTQIDVRTFQLAKGAVAAGLALVARNAGFKPHKHMEIVLAGAFGSALDPDDLVDLGVLPQEASGRIRAVGNTSLLGAAMVAVRPDVVERIESISAQARHVELATDPRFKDAYLASMALEPYSLRKRIKRAS